METASLVNKTSYFKNIINLYLLYLYNVGY